MFGDTPTKKVMYCYGIYQPLFDEIKRVIPAILFHESLPDKEEMMELSRDGHALLILDDLMQEVPNSNGNRASHTPHTHSKRFFDPKLLRNALVFKFLSLLDPKL